MKKTFLEARCAGLDKDCKIALAREVALVEEAGKLRQKCTTLEVNCGTLQRNWEEVSEKLRGQRQSLEAKGRELMECQLKLGITEDKANSFQKALFAAEDKIISLRDDFLFLTEAKASLEGQVKMLQATLAVRV